MPVFSSIDSEFWAYGIGAMSWSKEDEHDVLFVLLPTEKEHLPFEPLRVYMNHAEDNWAKPGDVPGWNGDREKPTLKPSIQIPQKGWHGYITHGELTKKSCKNCCTVPEQTDK